jgi:hypothetical protein
MRDFASPGGVVPTLASIKTLLPMRGEMVKVPVLKRRPASQGRMFPWEPDDLTNSSNPFASLRCVAVQQKAFIPSMSGPVPLTNIRPSGGLAKPDVVAHISAAAGMLRCF